MVENTLLVKCQDCGYQWQATVDSLFLKGDPCPHCQKGSRKMLVGDEEEEDETTRRQQEVPS